MSEQPVTGRDPTIATRTIRFERSGATPVEALEVLRLTTSLLPAVTIDWHSDSVPQTLTATSNGIQLTARAGDDHIELTARCTSDATSRGLKTQFIEALTDAVSDPERIRTTQAFEDRTADSARADPQQLFDRAELSIAREAALRLVVQSIDLTTLAGDDTPGRVRALSARALRPDPVDPTIGPCAAVCVYPNLVATAAELLADTDVAVASVAGVFPSGLSSLEVRLSDIAQAVRAGANEIDVVLNRSAFLAGNDEVVLAELQAMRDQIGTRVMKVILETSELQTPAAIRRAATLAIHAGTDWIKTSTGKSSDGATAHGVFAMAQTIAEHDAPIGLKVSGGVRTSADALGYLAILESVLGPDILTPTRVRFGASGLLGAVVADLAE